MTGVVDFISATAAVGGIAYVTMTGGEALHSNLQGPPVAGTGVVYSSVVAGEPAMIEWTLKKSTDCPGTFSRVWNGTDNFAVIEATRPATIPQSADYVTRNIQTDIPSLAPDGPLALTITGSYDCGDREQPFTLGPVTMLVVSDE